MALWVALFLADCVLVGLGLTYLTGVDLRIEERLAYGAVAGLMTMTIAGYGAGYVAGGLSPGVVAVSALLATAVSLLGWRSGLARIVGEAHGFKARLVAPLPTPSNPAPLLALLVPAWILTVWILNQAYVPDGAGGLRASHLSSWTDWQAHLTYASSFAYGENIPAEIPTAAGDDLPYHFGLDFFAGMLARIGPTVPGSLELSSGYLAFAFPAVMYLVGVRLFASRAIAFVAVLTFGLFGGLGFTRFFRDVRNEGLDVIWDLPTDHTRFPDVNILVENPVTGHFFPQRPTLVGFAVVLIVFALLWEARRHDSARTFAAAGVLVGVSPVFHVFSYGTALGLGLIWAILDRRRTWWWFVVPALALSLPVAAQLAPETSDLDAETWVQGDNELVFWWRNTGLFLPLLLVAQIWRGTVPRVLALASIPLWLWFLAPNVLRVAPSHPVNNTHWLVFVILLGSFFVAAVLVRLFRLSEVTAALAVVAFVSLTLSGALDIWKAADPEVDLWPLEVMDGDGIAAAEWAREATAPGSVFVIAPQHLHPVPALSGRSVVLGFVGWVNDLAVPDIAEREADLRAILGGLDGYEEAIERHGVDYVVIGPFERQLGADEAFWSAEGDPVFSQGAYSVYAVDST